MAPRLQKRSAFMQGTLHLLDDPPLRRSFGLKVPTSRTRDRSSMTGLLARQAFDAAVTETIETQLAMVRARATPARLSSPCLPNRVLVVHLPPQAFARSRIPLSARQFRRNKSRWAEVRHQWPYTTVYIGSEQADQSKSSRQVSGLS